MDKSDIKYDALYMYQDAGVERLLDDIYKVQEEEHDGDTNATVIRLDLESALSSRSLTPRERHCIALYYFACLNMDETAQILGVSIPSIHYRLKKAIPQLAVNMGGEGDSSVSQAIRSPITYDKYTPLIQWLVDVQNNEPGWFRVPGAVWAELRELFPPSEVQYEPKEVEYNWRSERSLKDVVKNKEILKPEIYPRFDNRGSKASHYTDDNGNFNGVKQSLIKVV
ncbi:sigma-70 family RNA polymerase sigma factor [Paenibacillus hexagrammi]|uniref:Sigma-70 family RNA polymerase sigma factor n=1 Tax=Paenibacillus hexagrammi TaxID=2908839 RepID=A0ABY3SUB8_9BACL|nr:sigma-70 family RNA polymerase sigma factor [Paenibacillus sp. YPD9-1]UJF36571.1 sigma-70 family RNA polymerase sigma factor [Paenibacillus sp. YPD9-1]